MILTFSRDSFMEDIIAGKKTTTIRLDPKKRWKSGIIIQYWRGSPRNSRSAKKPYQFATGKCIFVEEIVIYPDKNHIVSEFKKGDRYGKYHVYLQEDLDTFARKDGFKDWEDFKTWFHEEFHGRRIHFSEIIPERGIVIKPVDKYMK